jgi:phosphatidylserine/phosphatidylglycerophosphate/cardiolipin synthase-like enzyme
VIPTDLGQRVATFVVEVGIQGAHDLASRLEILGSTARADPDAIAAELAGTNTRLAVRKLIAGCSFPPQMIAVALRAASAAFDRARSEVRIDLVWTGPSSAKITFRDTEQALLEVVGSAQRSLTLCAFAAYRIESVTTALRSALDRAVRVDLILETPGDSGGRNEFDPSLAFAGDVLARIKTFVWPRARRPMDERGRHGALHAKFLLADSHALFLTSANLTEYALRLNLELGVLILGGPLPRNLHEHLAHLKASGVLVPRV